MTLPIRLIAIDIDGTLLNSQFQISKANLDTLRRAHEASVEIILVTGRRHTFAMPIAEMLGFPLWLISSNGAVTKSTDGELFHRDLLPAGTARKLLTWMDEFRGSAVVTFDREDAGALVIERADELHASISRWMEKNAAYITQKVPLEDCLGSDPVQTMFCGTIARMRAAQERLAASAMEHEITVLKTEYEARDLTIVDVLNYGCSKGHAVERWANRRGIRPEQVMAIGDNYNDLEMLEYAGRPVVMANAVTELKCRGWHVTGHQDEAGLAQAIERYVFASGNP